MKKIALLVFAFTIALFSIAQETGTSMPMKMAYGIDVGLNLANYGIDASSFPAGTAPGTKIKPSFHVGAFLDIPIGGIFSLKPQVIYSRQGSKLTAAGTGGTNVEFKESLDYIYVAPAALHLLTKSGFIVETGPMLGFLISAKDKGPAPYNDVNVKSMRNPLDFLWTAGIGYLTPFGVGLHARYNYGFSNVLNAKDDNAQTTGKARNRLIQIGLMFHIGGHGSHGGHDAP